MSSQLGLDNFEVIKILLFLYLLPQLGIHNLVRKRFLAPFTPSLANGNLCISVCINIFLVLILAKILMTLVNAFKQRRVKNSSEFILSEYSSLFLLLTLFSRKSRCLLKRKWSSHTVSFYFRLEVSLGSKPEKENSTSSNTLCHLVEFKHI